jgi:hypothetical protein
VRCWRATRASSRTRTAQGRLKQPALGAASQSSSVQSEKRRRSLRRECSSVTLMDRSQTHGTGLLLQQRLRLRRSQLAHRRLAERPALNLLLIGPAAAVVTVVCGRDVVDQVGVGLVRDPSGGPGAPHRGGEANSGANCGGNCVGRAGCPSSGGSGCGVSVRRRDAVLHPFGLLALDGATPPVALLECVGLLTPARVA